MRKGWTRRGIVAAVAMLPWHPVRAQTLQGPEALVADASPLPALRFTAADGMAQTLADYAGRPLLVNFWATWCVPCVAEMPALDRLAVAVPALAVLPLSSDRQGAPAVASFYAARGIAHLPVMLDPRAEAAHAIQSRGIPTTLAVNAGGKLVARAEGPIDWDSQAVRDWLATHLLQKS